MDKVNKCGSGGGNISIYSYNVRDLRDKEKRNRMINNFKNKLCGIIFLQETYIVPGDMNIWK